MHEIVLPDNVKPALEWVNNRVVQKVSPQRRHALAQLGFASALDAWARSRGSGMVGTEWRFQVQPVGEIRRTLVPDIAYLSYERMPKEELEQTDVPAIAPDIVVEVRSPEERQVNIDEKIRVYIAAGSLAVFLVDPERRTVRVVDAEGEHGVGDPLTHESLPGFSLPWVMLFELP